MSFKTIPVIKGYPEAIRSFLYEDGAKKMVIRGKSMQPFLPEGKIVELGESRLPLQRGRCYAFYGNKQLIAHRLVGLKAGSAVFIGDRGNIPEVVPQEYIIGEIIEQQPFAVQAIINAMNQVLVNKGSSPIWQFKIRQRIINLLFRFFGEEKSV